jgi:hypothetical protein
MIDYVAAVFRVQHKPFGKIISNIDEEKKTERAYRKKVLFKNSATSLTVKSTHHGQFVEVTGNYVKFLQHHNIFGSNNLRGLCVDIFKLVAEKFDIAYSHAEMSEIIKGNFSVTGVDIAANFRTLRREETALFIREVERHWRDQGKNVSNFGSETVYLNQNSKDLSLKFYDKRKQLSKAPLPNDIPERDRLLKYAERLVRAELTLGAAELKRRKLDSGSNWTVALAKRLIVDEIAASGIQGEIKRLLLPEEYASLKRKLQLTYRLWLHGDDVKSILDVQTYRRHRAELKDYAIDIGQPQPFERIVMADINGYLSPENMRTFPKFAREYGLIHLPKKQCQYAQS